MLTPLFKNREARLARQSRKLSSGRRTRQASFTSSHQDVSGSEHNSSECESEGDESQRQQTPQPHTQTRQHTPDVDDDIIGLWKTDYVGNAFASNGYTDPSIPMQDVAQAQRVSTSQQTLDFQPIAYQSLQPGFDQLNFDPFNEMFCAIPQPMHIAQPSDYIMAMYENSMQPLAFTAGPPLGHYNGNYGAYENAPMPQLDFDMSHYEEALADMTGFAGAVDSAWS
jgi:hypothetical protein